MELYHETAQDSKGNITNGAQVTVTIASSGAPATIYDAAGSSLSNPFSSGYDRSAGEIDFRAANGQYNVQVVADTTITLEVTLFDEDDYTPPGETVTSLGALINSADVKAAPIDADYLGLMDSGAANILKKLSWANVKTTIRTYLLATANTWSAQQYLDLDLRMASGKGIDFSGIGTAAEILDDYEEGTWTPGYEGGTTDFTSITYDPGQFNGKYTKVGQMVHIRGKIATDAISGGSGSLRITGLPFTCSASGCHGIAASNGAFTGSAPNGLNFKNGDTYATLFYFSDSVGGLTNIDVSDMGGTSNDNKVEFSGVYFAT